MIKVDMNKIEFKGIAPLLETEFTSMVRGLFEKVYKDAFGEHAEEKIRRDFERGLMSEEEMEKDLKNETMELIIRLAKKSVKDSADDGIEDNDEDNSEDANSKTKTMEDVIDDAVDDLVSVIIEQIKKDVPHSES